MTGTRNVDCHFECNADPESLPDEVKLDLYRIAQETLNNLMFRGETRIVKMELTQSDSEYCLMIENDSGAFYDLSTSPDLDAIKSRVASMNGNLQIISEPDKGTKVIVFLNAMRLHR
ncbi:MAG: hypothetical protein EOO18_03730 [Chryseobacterium sp.]|nr:MAG: hypothetical protein EOO18_03730 [Chryseobacterium sp.]